MYQGDNNYVWKQLLMLLENKDMKLCEHKGVLLEVQRQSLLSIVWNVCHFGRIRSYSFLREVFQLVESRQAFPCRKVAELSKTTKWIPSKISDYDKVVSVKLSKKQTQSFKLEQTSAESWKISPKNSLCKKISFNNWTTSRTEKSTHGFTTGQKF